MAPKSKQKTPFRAVFHSLAASIFIFFLYIAPDALRNPFATQRYDFAPNHARNRRISELESNFSDNPSENEADFVHSGDISKFCSELSRLDSDKQCEFLQKNPQCNSGGFADYLSLFYCTCRNFHSVGYIVLTLWLMTLFYLLGNTAADYFCCSLAKLSGLLRLSPTVAGVTLLPLGNGAPDVFASIAAFLGSGSGGVGLNSVLGGAVFVTCVVVGVVAFCVDGRGVTIDRKCFVRDVSFFLFSLAVLAVILVVGKIGVWGAMMFVLIYVVYAVVVGANELLREQAQRLKLDMFMPMLPVRGSVFSYASDDDISVYSPLFYDDTFEEVPRLSTLPQWMWASHNAIYSDRGSICCSFDRPQRVWGSIEEEKEGNSFYNKMLSVVQMPLSLPRKLTIPVVEEDRWSKKYAVFTALLAPILLAFLWDRHVDVSMVNVIAYIVASILGLVLATLALFYTSHDHPPRKYLLLWVSGGFVMSIVWFYIVANELLALLVALGVILHINPSVLGVTVLAWGNSMGDLMSNMALALNGGDGVQIAMSGCYAGPMFNTLVGLGASMLLAAWKVKPASFLLPQDSSLIFTMAFLIAGLIWAMVILLRNDMCPNKILGFGLIALYLIFISVRMSSAIGIF